MSLAAPTSSSPPSFRTMRSAFSGSPSAFTLIEILVVVGIIATLAAITMPAVKSLTQGNSRKQAINQIRAYLSQARSIAIAQHRQAGVVFFRETERYASPRHGDVIALQFFVEEYDQTTIPPKNPKNTLFTHYTTAREFLPTGIAVAALNDVNDKSIINEDSSGGHNLAILFDAQGQMITRHGVGRRNLPGSGDAGTYPYAIGDWRFASQGTVNSDNSSNGISSPGIFIYDQTEFRAQNIPAGTAGDAARATWIKQHADVILINANTGSFLQ